MSRFQDLTEDDVRSTSMGAGGEDIQLSSAARKRFPYSVECKSNKAFSIYKLYEQAVSNAKKNEPLLVIRGDRKKALVVVNAEHFIDLIKDRNGV